MTNNAGNNEKNDNKKPNIVMVPYRTTTYKHKLLKMIALKHETTVNSLIESAVDEYIQSHYDEKDIQRLMEFIKE